MSTAKHTSGKWSHNFGYSEDFCHISGPNKLAIMCIRWGYEPKEVNRANIDHIVACVNACEKMKDPAAEIAGLRKHLAEIECGECGRSELEHVEGPECGRNFEGRS